MSRILSALLIAGVSAAVVSQPALAKVVAQGEGSFVTHESATVQAAPYETWLALINPENWWSNSHTWSGDSKNMYISAQAGGCFCELLPLPKDAMKGVRRGSAHHMTVVLANPPKVLRMRGGLGPLQSEPVDGVLTVTLIPSGTGTKIVFEYVVGGYMRFETAQIAKAVDRVVAGQLGNLVALLGPAQPKTVTGPNGGTVGPQDVAAEALEGGAADKSQNDETEGADGSPEQAEPTQPLKPAQPLKPSPPRKKLQSVEEAFGSLGDDKGE